MSEPTPMVQLAEEYLNFRRRLGFQLRIEGQMLCRDGALHQLGHPGGPARRLHVHRGRRRSARVRDDVQDRGVAVDLGPGERRIRDDRLGCARQHRRDAAAAASFTVAGFPATTAGDAQAFTVTVLDNIGQVATGYAGTVFFSSSDVQAGVPASYTFTAADAGVHTFTATLRTAGTQSIFVRDFGGLSGSQVGISVRPAAFAGYRLLGPLRPTATAISS